MQQIKYTEHKFTEYLDSIREMDVEEFENIDLDKEIRATIESYLREVCVWKCSNNIFAKWLVQNNNYMHF